MKPLSNINLDLQFFKGKKIILWGAGIYGKKLLTLYRFYQIEVFAFCDSDPKKIGTSYHGLEVFSPNMVQAMEKDNLVLQVSCIKKVGEMVKAQAKEMGFSCILTAEESYEVLSAYHRYAMVKKFPSMRLEEEKRIASREFLERERFYQHYDKMESLNFLCMAGKTGDMTLLSTLNAENIPIRFIDHTPFGINRELAIQGDRPVKIITGVRDPFAQKISGLYQGLSTLHTHHFLWKLPIEVLDRFFNSNMSDISYIFEKTGYWNETDFFMEDYKIEILDYTKYPFDKEKGYSIIKEGNLEIFFYQLEKLNHIIPELADFVGGSFTELQNENEASSKWIAESYNEAKKELKVPRDVFESFYQADWVEHFYSPEDIAKFKARWEKNVQKED